MQLAHQHRCADRVVDGGKYTEGKQPDAVLTVAYCDDAFLADAPLDSQDCIIGSGSQSREMWLSLGKYASATQIVVAPPEAGEGRAPVPELNIQIVEIVEARPEVEVLADLLERSLDLAFRLAR